MPLTKEQQRRKLSRRIDERIRRGLEGHALSLAAEATRLREHAKRLIDLADDYAICAEALEKEIATLHGFLEKGELKRMGTDYLRAATRRREAEWQKGN